MVPAYVLLVTLPLVACGMSSMNGDAADQMKMMQMMMNAMNAMNSQKGWGNDMQQHQQQQAPNFSMENKEEYEAYMKWCAENRERQAEQEKQQELLEAFKNREEKRKQEMAKAKLEMEAQERSMNMKAQWKSWETKMQMAQNFGKKHYEVMEMKHKYYYTVTFEFLNFCKCSDFTGEVEKFFKHDGVHTGDHEQFDLEDLGLDAASSQNPAAVAQALNQLSEQDQVKAFFGGLAHQMCEGARGYYNQVVEWEKQHKFLEALG